MKAIIRIEIMELFKGFYGIGFLPGPAFKVQEIKMWIFFCCKPYHGISVTCRRNVFCFEWRISRWDEDYRIKSGKFPCLFGSTQVPEVDWIKGAA
jgi:hypothetical protein